MCITRLCENPTEPGVWWREDDSWIKYPPDQATAIKLAKANNESTFHLGSITSKKYPSGHKYEIDLATMMQVNSHSKYRRQVLIVYKEGEEVKISEETPLGNVYFNSGRNDDPDDMFPLVPGETKKVIVAAAAGKTKVTVEVDTVVDLVNLRATEYERWCFGLGARAADKYRVSIDCPWNPDVTKTTMDKQKTLQKKVLGGLVKEVYKDTLLEETVLANHVKTLATHIGGNEKTADKLVTALIKGKLHIIKEVLNTNSV